MRTAIRTDPRNITRRAIAACAIALSAAATACADATAEPIELAELQRDHERCLADRADADTGVRYEDYQDCMASRGWSDPDLSHHS